MVLPQAFYAQPTLKVAKALLGKRLIHQSSEGRTEGIIVETEAYLGRRDLASHSYRGETPRNAPMWGPVGCAYVYFTYGMHYCFNIVTGQPGEAVLIRALKPTIGIKLMQQRRTQTGQRALCSGPAKLVQAMGIHISHNRAPLQDTLRVEGDDQSPLPAGAIVTTTRIGIKQAADKPWRFYLKDNEFISRA